MVRYFWEDRLAKIFKASLLASTLCRKIVGETGLGGLHGNIYYSDNVLSAVDCGLTTGLTTVTSDNIHEKCQVLRERLSQKFHCKLVFEPLHKVARLVHSYPPQ